MNFSNALKELQKGEFIKRESMGNNVIYMTSVEETKRNSKLNTEKVKISNQILNMNLNSKDSVIHQFSNNDILAGDWIVVDATDVKIE